MTELSKGPVRTLRADVRRLAGLAMAMFAVQAGFFAYIAPLPIALEDAGFSELQIGIAVGAAHLIQAPAALVGGQLINRFGGRAIFYCAAGAYVLAALAFVLGLGEDVDSWWGVVATRALQGLGFGLGLPAALSVVTQLTSSERRGLSLASITSAQNLALGVLPPVALAILYATSLRGVGLLACSLVLAGVITGRVVMRSAPSEQAANEAAVPRVLMRVQWLPLVFVLWSLAFHFGIVIAYLPQRAESHGASVAIYFTVEAVAILLSRIPAGIFSDRRDPNILLLTGVVLSFFGVLTLTLPPAVHTLAVAGTLTGLGAGMGVTSALVVLHRFVGNAASGTAFGLFSVSMAIGMASGSILGGIVVTVANFELAMMGGAAALAASAVLVQMGLARRR